MKRNEKILVYGVTGFLVAILVIAVVFGNEDLTRAVEASTKSEAPRTLQDLITDPDGEAVNSTLAEAGAGIDEEEAAAGKDTAADEEALSPAMFIGPLAVVQPVEVISTETISVLGKSRREGNYRVVAVQPGDTFSGLVQRWCGSLDLGPDVERLNEGVIVDALSTGLELWFPWVEEEILLEANDQRLEEVQERAAAAPTVYSIQTGDSLWKLAEAAVGLGGAPAYIEEIKALNPEIENFDRLSVGQQIRLPRR